MLGGLRPGRLGAIHHPLPILTWGAVQHSLTFADNYGEGVPNYLYNLAPGLYDEVLICHETPENDALRELVALVGGRLVDCACTQGL